MQSFCGRIRLLTKTAIKSPHTFDLASFRVCSSQSNDFPHFSRLLPSFISTKNYGSLRELPALRSIPSVAPAYRESRPGLSMTTRELLHWMSHRNPIHKMLLILPQRLHPASNLRGSIKQPDTLCRQEILFSYLSFWWKDNISYVHFEHAIYLQILDKEAVEEVRTQREIPDIRPGYIIQLRLEVPENKRRVSTVKGIVIARRNAGLNSTIRLRRLVAGVGVESLLPLYSPNIKEIKVLDKKKVRRAKLYYLRDKMNALRK
ncbi:hypothetical protein OSB04_004276 [Centaurea solstitialis]|uniref:Ribosomal protein L19 n=1 Tax=Centaurea solstitialis TaxID=347529 RepID=A0AA38WU80_9ASTR|nr:hypothetical protein OSB04_004276 [Centaurea solstitialis]